MRAEPEPLRPDALDWLLPAPLGGRLERLSLASRIKYHVRSSPRPDLGAWLGAIAKLPHLRALEFEAQFNWKVSLARGSFEDRWALTLHAYDASDTTGLEPVLRNVPHGAFSRVVHPKDGGRDMIRILRPFLGQG